MNKSKKVIIGFLIVIIIVIGVVVAYKVIEKSVTNRAGFNFTVENISSNPVDTINHDSNKEYVYGDVFYAKIKKISTYNNITTILVEGLEVNDINHRGLFEFSIKDDTELLWRGTEIKLSDLKEGQNISITSTGLILESSPAGLTKVSRIILLDDKL